jgi:hypothetical protein
MLKVFDERGFIGYAVEVLEAYCSGNTICGLCAYPYELVRIKNARGVINPSKYAIVYVSHSHTSEYQKPALRVVRWLNDEEVEKFRQMTYKELIEAIREDDCY